jgi:hypothetical protein
LQAALRRIEKEKQRLLEEKRRLIEETRLIRDQANRKECPLCVAMKKRRTSLPKGINSTHELKDLVPWEEAFTDSSGKFRRKSKQGNIYFTVFVCAKTGDKIAILHVTALSAGLFRILEKDR